MNIVLLVNTHNLANIRQFVEAAAVSQTTKTPGAIAVVYQQKLGAETIQELVAPLVPLFSAASSLPVLINSGLNDDARNATLFALFVAQVYARFPGPWLIVDGPGVPKDEEFVTELAKQHKLLGGTASGRVSVEGSGLTPVGPVVIGLPSKKLNWFSPGASESWRARARHLLGRCGFKIVPMGEYLFTIPNAFRVAPEPEKAPEAIKAPAYTTPTEPPVFNPSVLDGLPDAIGATGLGPASLTEAIETVEKGLEVASTQPRFQVGDSVRFAPHIRNVPEGDFLVEEVVPWESGFGMRLSNGNTQCQSDLILAPTEPEPSILDQYAAKSREELFALIEERGLEKPHHATGAAKLVALLEENDQPAA